MLEGMKNREYTDMNESMVQNFTDETEKSLPA